MWTRLTGGVDLHIMNHWGHLNPTNNVNLGVVWSMKIEENGNHDTGLLKIQAQVPNR